MFLQELLFLQELILYLLRNLSSEACGNRLPGLLLQREIRVQESLPHYADEQEYSVYGSYKSKKMCVPRWGRGDIQAYG